MKLGFAVLEANNGLEACDLYDSERGTIVCVFLDLNMPILDGWQTAQRLRQMEDSVATSQASSLPHLNPTSDQPSCRTSGFETAAAAAAAVRMPVIVCTANDLHARHGFTETVTSSALLAGATEVMKKPMNSSVVQRILDRHIPSWREMVTTRTPAAAPAKTAAQLRLSPSQSQMAVY